MQEIMMETLDTTRREQENIASDSIYHAGLTTLGIVFTGFCTSQAFQENAPDIVKGSAMIATALLTGYMAYKSIQSMIALSRAQDADRAYVTLTQNADDALFAGTQRKFKAQPRALQNS